MKDEGFYYKKALQHTVSTMMARAKTAPKAKGVDSLIYKVAEAKDIEKLSEEVERMGREKDIPFFIRDSKNIESLKYILFIGTKDQARGVPNCGFCGYENCGQKTKGEGHCAYGMIDMGIAIGSALSVAQAHGIDSRVMFTLGKAAINLGWMESAVACVGIPLSISEKNRFFDRSTT